MIEDFKKLIDDAERILITSHISPDPDAVSSTLLLGETLKTNFSDKQILMVLEEEPARLDFITGYDDIGFQPVADAIEEFKPDLFILLDGNNYERCSRHDGQKIRDYIKENNVKTVIIDHHEPANKEEADVFINRGTIATTQEIYELCFHDLKLNGPTDYIQTAMVGLYADSGGFVYTKDGNEKKMFDLVKELVEAGAQIEKIKNQLSSYNQADVRVFQELFGNLSGKDDYTYTFISDNFIDNWLKTGHPQAELKPGVNTFLDEYIRNIEGREWGFMVCRDTLQGERIYSVSLRSVNGVRDVSEIARKLNGGGHKPAAGGKIQADSVEDAVAQVQKAIAETP